MPVNQQRVADVPLDNCWLVYSNFRWIVNQVNASTPREVVRLNNPGIPLAVRLLKFLKVLHEIAVFVRQCVSVWYKVKH